MSPSVATLFPQLCLAVGGLVVLMAAVVSPRAPRVLSPLLGAAGLVPVCAWAALAAGAPGLARCYAGLFGGIGLLTLGLLAGYAERRRFGGEVVHALVPWSTLGMLLLAGATDWLMLAIGLEMTSLCLYALVASRLCDPGGTEAALKYFLPGAMALALVLFGVGLIYAGSGTLAIAASLAAGGPLVTAGLGIVLVGLGFKLSLAPLHVWTPDVYQGAPAPIAGLLSTGSKAAVAAALLGLAASAPPQARELLWPALAAVAGLTMAVGNIGALCQARLKRLLAYSSIAQMGYVVLAGLGTAAGGREAGLFYLAAYALMDLGAFGALAVLSGPDADRDDLASWRGLGWTRPWPAGLLLLSLLALAGLPPTVGFIGKFMVFGAALAGGYVGLTVFGVLMAAVGIFYSLRVAVTLYMRPAIEALPAPVPAAGPAVRLALAVIAASLLGLGLLPGPLLDAIGRLVAG